MDSTYVELTEVIEQKNVLWYLHIFQPTLAVEETCSSPGLAEQNPVIEESFWGQGPNIAKSFTREKILVQSENSG